MMVLVMAILLFVIAYIPLPSPPVLRAMVLWNNLGEPPDEAFQTWLDSIEEMEGTEVVCESDSD
jgi:hypothetical protein